MRHSSVLICGFLIFPLTAFAVIGGKEVTKTLPPEKATREAISPVVKLELKRKDGQSGTCSGTVIEKDPPLILTAEHCVEDKEITRLTYKDGDLNNIVRTAKIKKVHKKGRRDRNDSKNDYAVIELEPKEIPEKAGEANFPVASCPVVIPPINKNGAPDPRFPYNNKLTIAGWGANEVTVIGTGDNAKLDPNNPPKGVGTLRYGTNEATVVKNGLLYFQGISMSIPGEPLGRGVSVGPGDSGGPVFARQNGKTYVVGINSYLDKPPMRTPNGQINAVIDVCDKEVGKFVRSVYEEAKDRGNRSNRRNVSDNATSGSETTSLSVGTDADNTTPNVTHY